MLLALSVAVLDRGADASAQARPDDALAARLVVSDPLALAEVVARAGEDAILERLGQPGDASAGLDPAIVLLAIRAAEWLAEPERALPRLVELARGHDPTLAPRAMESVVRIVEATDLPSLEAREADLAAWRDVLPLLRALAEDADVRADVRGAAARTSERLRAVVEG